MKMISLIAVLLLMAACTARQAAQTKVVPMHAIQDQHLRELMAEMNSLVLSEKEMTDLQRDARRREYNQNMAKTAQALCKTVDNIVATLPSLKLNPAEQARFLAMADKLRGEAQNLKELAANNRSDAIPAELENIQMTCQNCHRLFRSSGG